MNKKDDVIRNPARRLSQIIGRVEKYQPEHVKMGIDPVEPAHVSDDDFRYAFNKRKQFVTSSKGPNPSVAKPIAKVEVMAAQEMPRNREVPKQVRVSSGFNHEHTWRPTAEFYDEETLPPDAVNEEWYQAEGKDNTTLDEEAKQFSTEQIKYDDLNFPKEKAIPRARQQKAASQEKSKKYHHLLDLTSEQYCIAVEGNIVFITDDLDQLENMVEYVLFDQESPLGDVSIENIAVFKRLSLKAGVVVKE